MQKWNNLEKQFKWATDRIGTHIDPGIMETVIAMNAVGLYTVASCEGHLDHGCTYPWIDVSLEEAKDLAQKIIMLLHAGKREDEETQRFMKEHRALLLQAEYGLIEQLNLFYQHHPFNYDRHLSIWRFGNGQPRLQSHGAEYQQFREFDEQTVKLKEYQAEMQAFTDFLKMRFFGENT